MIRLAEVVEAFVPELEAQYGDRLLPGQRNALAAILRCRTEACGTAAIHCTQRPGSLFTTRYKLSMATPH